MTIFLLDNPPSAPSFAAALGATPLDAAADPATWPEALWHDDARLLVHVNLGPRRSQRRGLELVERLRGEWGVTATALFVSFEAEETLRATPHGGLLTQPGHGFLRLPATVEEIQQGLRNLTPVAEPERYLRSAAGAALGLLLDGPAADPVNRGPGALVTVLSCWSDESPDRTELAEYLAGDPWWQTWSAALAACRTRLARLTDVPAECVAGLEAIGKHLTVVAAFAEQVLDPTWPAPTAEDLAAANRAADALWRQAQDLGTLRHELTRPEGR
jgi:hypothetical protein